MACQKVPSSVGDVNLMALQWCSNSLKSEFSGLGSAFCGDMRKTQSESSAWQSRQNAGRTERSTLGVVPLLLHPWIDEALQGAYAPANLNCLVCVGTRVSSLGKLACFAIIKFKRKENE